MRPRGYIGGSENFHQSIETTMLALFHHVVADVRRSLGRQPGMDDIMPVLGPRVAKFFRPIFADMSLPKLDRCIETMTLLAYDHSNVMTHDDEQARAHCQLAQAYGALFNHLEDAYPPHWRPIADLHSKRFEWLQARESMQRRILARERRLADLEYQLAEADELVGQGGGRRFFKSRVSASDVIKVDECRLHVEGEDRRYWNNATVAILELARRQVRLARVEPMETAAEVVAVANSYWNEQCDDKIDTASLMMHLAKAFLHSHGIKHRLSCVRDVANFARWYLQRESLHQQLSKAMAERPAMDAADHKELATIDEKLRENHKALASASERIIRLTPREIAVCSAANELVQMAMGQVTDKLRQRAIVHRIIDRLIKHALRLQHERKVAPVRTLAQTISGQVVGQTAARVEATCYVRGLFAEVQRHRDAARFAEHITREAIQTAKHRVQARAWVGDLFEEVQRRRDSERAEAKPLTGGGDGAVLAALPEACHHETKCDAAADQGVSADSTTPKR